MCTGTHPFIPAPDVARVRMVYTSSGQENMNVFYFKGDTPFDAAALSTLADEVHTAWTARFKPLQDGNVTLNYIEATALDSDSAPQVTALVGTGGTLTGTSLPGSVTIAVKFATGNTGRSKRGRMYWIGLTESEIDQNVVTSTFASNLLTAVTGFFDDIITATGYTHVIVSYCGDGAWRTTALITPVLSYLLTDNNIDNQRRRLQGRGV